MQKDVKMNEQCVNKIASICKATTKKPRVVFMGTSTISVVCLEALRRLPVELVLVITKPDQWGDRHQLAIPEVKQKCLEKNYAFIQPNKLIEHVNEIKSYQPDFLVTCSFGKIVPDEVLNLFKHCINVHASLLPAYRGASPMQMAIANRETTTGVSLMEMIKELDAGRVYWQNSIPIAIDETFDSLLNKFCASFNDEFLVALWDILTGKNNGVEQSELIKKGGKLSFAPIITKQMCFIDWSKSARHIDAHVRSLFSSPLAKTHYQDFVIKVLRCRVCQPDDLLQSELNKCTPGEIVTINQNGILVKTTDPDVCLCVEKIQLPNKTPCEIKQIIHGNHCFKKHQKFF